MNNKTKPVTEENGSLVELMTDANYEIFKLAEATCKLCEGEEDAPIIHGMMARIKALTEVIYHSQKLLTGKDADGMNISKLEAVYSGRMF